MKVNVERHNFLEALNFVSGAGDMHVRTAGMGVEVLASGLHLSLSVVVPAQVSGPGEFTVSVQDQRKISSVVKLLPKDSEISVQAEGDAVTIRCGRIRHKFQTLAYGSPELPLPGEYAKVSARILADCIDRTVYASAKDDSRYVFEGILFKTDGTVVATDGRRMAIVSRGEPFPWAHDLIVPAAAAKQIRKILGDAPVFAGATDRVFAVRNAESGHSISAALVEGSFPDYKQVIPRSYTGAIEFDRSDAEQVLRQMSAVSPSQRVCLEIQGGKMVVSAGDSDGELNVSHSGDPLKIGFNAGYLLDAILSFGSKTIRMDYSHSSAPVRLLNPEDEAAIGIVMPMRLD